MLLDDDVVSDGQAKASAFAGGLGREEGVEHLFLHLGRDAGAVVANRDLHAVAEVLGRGHKGWLIVVSISCLFALGRRIEAVRDQVQQSPRNVLREHIGLHQRPDQRTAPG